MNNFGGGGGGGGGGGETGNRYSIETKIDTKPIYVKMCGYKISIKISAWE